MPDQIDRLVPDRQPGARILQHLHAVAGERGRHVVVVVVVAEDAEHAVWRGERRERVGGRVDVVAIAAGDVVAAEHDQIRLLGHQRG